MELVESEIPLRKLPCNLLVEMESRHQDKGVWLATWGLSELEMGFRAMKLDESTLDTPKLTGWGIEEAQLERSGEGGLPEARKESASKRGGISTPKAAGSSKIWTED